MAGRVGPRIVTHGGADAASVKRGLAEIARGAATVDRHTARGLQSMNGRLGEVAEKFDEPAMTR